MKPRVAVLRYGVGNIYSVKAGLERAGASVSVVYTLEGLGGVDGVVLPGVGSYAAATRSLDAERGRLLRLAGRGVPILGICLGMQLLFEASEEGGGRGLGVLPGVARRLRAEKLPHIGWSRVRPVRDSLLLRGVEPDTYFYFVHSFAFLDIDRPWVTSVASYCDSVFAATVEKHPFYGAQFHPEKSGAQGLAVLRNFVSMLRGDGL